MIVAMWIAALVAVVLIRFGGDSLANAYWSGVAIGVAIGIGLVDCRQTIAEIRQRERLRQY